MIRSSNNLGATRRPTQQLLLRWILGLICVSLALPGCALKRPSWGSPGTAQQQQLRATQHDPYAYNDIAPEVVGGRPRDYAKQTPEAVRVDDGFRN